MREENKLIIEQLNKFGRVPQTSELLQMIKQLEQENKQLKDNWKNLKKFAKENLYFYSGYQGEDLEIDISIQGILDKIQELEQGSDSNEKI